MKWNLRWRLSLMMFLQYGLWGAWVVYLPLYLFGPLKFSGAAVGVIYSAMPLACMISPFIGGQIADRWVPSQWFMAVANVVCGVLMLIMASQTTLQSLYPLMLVFSLFYAPTLAVANSICFHHLKDPEKEFPYIRVWGAIGWVIALLVLWFWLHQLRPNQVEKGHVCLYLAGIFALLLGILSPLLPHTPPAKKKEKPWAFLEALKLMKDWRFAAFIIIGVVVATQLQFYYMLATPFLGSLGIPAERAAAWTSLAQIVEAVVTLSLAFLLARLGYRKALALGVIAWPIRYIVFALGDLGAPQWLVIASLGLHGLCYVLFFIVGMIYINSVAPSDIRASSQSLWVFATFGVGLFIGSYFTGWITDLFTKTVKGVGQTNYFWVFVIPVLLTVACAVAYLKLFREMPKVEEEGEAAGESAEPEESEEPEAPAELQGSEQPSDDAGPSDQG